jgi:CheY-like chemotaxis protein
LIIRAEVMAKTILIAEDSASVRKFISLALKMQGFNVIAAVDGMDAIEKLPTIDSLDLIITDINMPNIDGIRLIQNIRNDSMLKDIPIIILTSLSDDKDIQAGMDAGANSYLIKPFNTKKIQYEVSKYIEQ